MQINLIYLLDGAQSDRCWLWHTDTGIESINIIYAGVVLLAAAISATPINKPSKNPRRHNQSLLHSNCISWK
ncbi:MAG: hypothetical protein HC877_19665 [Thioploca sp.]|nr:hypothetical protein [Thioploca sp.]